MPFSNVFGGTYKCLDKCPLKINEFNVKEELYIDSFSRSCIFKPEYDHSRYNFGLLIQAFHKADLGQQESSKNLLESVNSFWESYERYLKRDQWFFRDNKLEGDSKNKNHSEPCNFNGFVREIISPYKETSYVCYCTKGHLGEQCEITAGLFISSQIYIAKTLQEIIHIKPDISDLMLMLAILNKPKVDIKN